MLLEFRLFHSPEPSHPDRYASIKFRLQQIHRLSIAKKAQLTVLIVQKRNSTAHIAVEFLFWTINALILF